MHLFKIVLCAAFSIFGVASSGAAPLGDAPLGDAPLGTTTQSYKTGAPPWMRWGVSYPAWIERIEPFRVIGNIYYVGSKGLSSFLITSDKGHMLIDGGLPQNANLIIENIKELGFDIENVKILLNSHAHFDHSGGLQALKKKSGAQMIANEADRSALEGGFYLGFENNINYTAPPVRVDRLVEDGEVVRLGTTTLTAQLTPGHTRGCTSWTMKAYEEGKPYDVLFFCGATVAGNSLVPPQYEGIVKDYRYTFEKTRNWQPDVLLVNHPFFFNMEEKRARQMDGDTLAFVDRDEFPALISQLEDDFEKSLKKAQAR